MKKSTMSQKMRWVAGVLYGIFFVYQLLCVNMYFDLKIMLDFPTTLWAAQLVTGLMGAGACVWLFSSRDEVKEGTRRAFVVATVLAVVFELVVYAAQMDLFNQVIEYLGYITLQGGKLAFPNTLFLNAAENVSIAYMVIVMIRLMLLILAAFFVTSAREGAEEEEEGMFDEEQAPPQEQDVLLETTVLDIVDDDQEIILLETEQLEPEEGEEAEEEPEEQPEAGLDTEAAEDDDSEEKED